MTPARSITALLLAAGIFFAGYMANRQSDPATSLASAKQAESYLCPMHPQYTSDRPGACPICGMSLVPDSLSADVDGSAAMNSSSPDKIRISADKQQLAGVLTEKVRRSTISHLIRVPGRITVDTLRLYRITAAADGWILKMGEVSAGAAVKRGEILATYYTPTMMVTQQNLLYALGRSDQMQKTDVLLSIQRTSLPLNLESALDNIRSLGMDDLQIQELQRTRQYTSEIQIHSPVTGYVDKVNISPQQHFDKGDELFAVADVDHVWVMTDIFEKDRAFLRRGTVATVHYQDCEFHARLSDTLPQFDPETRTLKTRFELDNPDNILLPDMFVDVEFPVEKPAAITVPADAVINTGRRKTVYVEQEEGVFVPRLVQTGWRLGDRVQITHGLDQGELIVVSGNFLIDSESRMRFTQNIGSTSGPEKEKAKDLVCGMDVDPKSPNTLKLEYKGRSYYFCSAMCKNSFESNPEKYVKPGKGSGQGRSN